MPASRRSRSGSASTDAVVVGAGPNGLAAAIELAEAGWSVLVLEAGATVGGGCRSAELTLPGFTHDVCSAIHPLAAGSPFMGRLPLAAHGLELLHPRHPLAHPLDDGDAAVLERSVAATAAGLGRDGRAYGDLMEPLVRRWDDLAGMVLGPARPPRHPALMARFGLHAVRSARGLAESRFRDPPARALFAGLAAHSELPLEEPLTAAFGLLLGVTAHAVGWPAPRGGAQAIVDAMASYLRSLGGRIETDSPVASLDGLPEARAVLLDVSPHALLSIAGDRLPADYRRALEGFAHGPGVFKIDAALDGPVPWRAAACREAGTVHVGGTLEEVAESEAAVGAGHHSERPYVLVAQQSVFDPGRAPEGKHTLWAYCHVPAGSTRDMTEPILAQIDRFAPGVRDRILSLSTMGPADLQAYNPNYVGGDISGGSHAGLQLFARPVPKLDPYAAPVEGLYLCSASTPPGAGVHGMCGHHAARSVLRRQGGARG